MLTTLNPVFRLRPWTIRKHNGSYFISQDDHPKKWGKSYASLQRACTAVARKMQAEWEERARRYAARPQEPVA